MGLIPEIVDTVWYLLGAQNTICAIIFMFLMDQVLFRIGFYMCSWYHNRSLRQFHCFIRVHGGSVLLHGRPVNILGGPTPKVVTYPIRQQAERAFAPLRPYHRDY